ncbi:MAG: ATP-dependent DNA ligase [Pseudomonadota bacterium]
MKRFAALFTALDQTTRTTQKVDALSSYFQQAADADKVWTIAILSGRRPKRGVTTTLMREWAAEAAGLPLWLIEESYPIVGDLSETIALILPYPKEHEDQSLSYWINIISSLGSMEVADKRAAILKAWDSLRPVERFLFNKLITGGLRIGVSQKLMTRALAQATGIDEPELAHRLMGNWSPAETTFEDLILSDDPSVDLSRPYPFYLAYQLESLEALGPPIEWRAEQKWDGIRGQIILRDGQHFVWSRGEELVTDRFPEFGQLRDFCPSGTVIDGEILAFRDGRPLPFAALQRRIGRKTVPKKLREQTPVVVMVYDLLEQDGTDIRAQAYDERRAKLERLAASLPEGLPLRLSPAISFENWDSLARERENSREKGVEGIMLKRAGSPYLSGRKKGDWWKWKIDPLTIDAVMIYAQSGHGRRANLFTDFTFAVWNGDELVPFTKAYSGLTDAEFRQITAWVRKNTKERFGPVRAVTPQHVFEIAFEGIQVSSRHKSGVALRFPRMSRWRHDKPVQEANTLDDLKDMLDVYG